ncbi:phage/plasmid primase, P4 family [Clostridium intestinale]|uniref:phage/plasmid primase, P4 family n=1 Tax=Clostridium intestinale TaxID=36845 RepID=UPI002DD686C8|nr:phage/plasmid primase, P4 family [Clostridium intestinale]WRY50604.1 phage/plasmid primase, P4 family [Clostridium intestinale]
MYKNIVGRESNIVIESKINQINKDLNRMIKSHVSNLFESMKGEFINIRAIPNNESKLKPREYFVEIKDDFNETIRDVIEIVDKHKEYNIFYAPVVKDMKDGKKEHCVKCSTLYIDIDEHNGIKFKDMNPDERNILKVKLVEELRSLYFKPSYIVNSGNGIHCYWRTTVPIDVQKCRLEFEATLRYFANILPEFKGDRAVCNIAHMLRLPGTYNYKDIDNPKPCEPIDSNDEIIHDFDKIFEFVKFNEVSINKDSDKSFEKSLYKAFKKLDNVTIDELTDEILNCEFMKHVYENPQEQSYQYWIFIASTLASFGELGRETFHLISKQYENYDFEEATAVFDSVSKRIVAGEVGSVLCETICKEGFQCSCKCNKKSIAGNIFSNLYNIRKQVNNDIAIDEAIEALEPEDDNVKNMRKLRDFIFNNINKTKEDELVKVEYLKKAMKKLEIKGGLSSLKKLLKNSDSLEENLFLKIGNEILENKTMISIAKVLYRYNNGYYKIIDDEILKKEIIEKIEDDYTKNNVENILYYIISKTAIKEEHVNFNKKENMVCGENGMLKISDTEAPVLYPHNPQFNCLNQLNIAYDKNAKCDLWLNFLDKSFRNFDEQDKTIIIQALQEWFGYLLIPGNQLQRMLFLIGRPRTGKGVLEHIMACLIGQENVSAFSIGELHDKVNSAMLLGKLANIGGEVDSYEKFKVSFVKMLTGEDKISGKMLYKNPISFKNESKLIFSCNHIPLIQDRSNAMYERILAISVDNYVPVEERDPNLKLKLEGELSGILNWAIEGRLRLFKRGYFIESPSMIELKERMREENNSVVYWFKTQKDLLNTNKDFYTLKELFDDYKTFCINEELKPLIKRNFKTALENIEGIEVIHKSKPDQLCVVIHWDDINRKIYRKSEGLESIKVKSELVSDSKEVIASDDALNITIDDMFNKKLFA